MPFSLLLDEATVLPLRAILFQCLLLLVAISLEAMVLRRQLRLGYQPSIRYASSLNLLAVVLGWILFLGVEPLMPVSLKRQIMSYVLFGHFYNNAVVGSLEATLVVTGLVIFFLTFWVKAKGLEWLTALTAAPIVKPPPPSTSSPLQYVRSRSDQKSDSPHTLAILQANALSFTAVLLLLLLRHQIGPGQ